MSQSLTLELNEQAFAAIQRQAQMIGISPAQLGCYLAGTTVSTGFQATFE